MCALSKLAAGHTEAMKAIWMHLQLSHQKAIAPVHAILAPAQELWVQVITWLRHAKLA
jgi:hypothetical protein